MSQPRIPLPSDKVVIISIFPAPLNTVGSGMQVDRGQFVMDAAPAVDGETLPGGKAYQSLDVHWGSVMTDTHSNNEGPDFIERGVPCDVIGQNLVDRWARQAYNAEPELGIMPGVAMLPVGETKPSKELLAKLAEGQRRYFMKFFNQAWKFFNDRKFEEIGDDHRRAARWLGKGDNPWDTDQLRQQPVVVQAISPEMEEMKRELAELKSLMAGRSTKTAPAQAGA